MNKIDKKSIILLLVLTIVFTIAHPIAVNALIEVDPALENSNVKAKVLGNRALLSDGSLWKIESATDAKLEDTGIKAYNFVYSRSSTSRYDYYAKLRNNNTLNVKSTEMDKETSVKAEKNISNVKKIVEQYDGGFLAYLTYENELYFLDPYEAKGEIQFHLVAKDVEKVLGQYYIKDGKTYLASGNKVLDKEITKAYKDYCTVGNVLYEGVYYGEDSYRFNEVATDFSEFTYTENTNGWMTYKATDGTIKELGTLSSSQSIYKYHPVDGSITYYLSGKNVFFSKSNVVSTLLKNVVDMNLVNDSIVVFVRSDGTVWANKLGIAQTCTKIISPSVLKLADVKTNEWYFNAVKYVVNNNIIKGYNSTTFAPNDKLTRGQLVTILYRMEGEPEISGTPKFSDVKDSKQYYYKPVKWATDNKIVSGYDTGKFGPEDNITREQLAVILWKYAKYKGKDISKVDDLKKFGDTKKISSWALSQVKWAVAVGVITGNNNTTPPTINPLGNATRAEVAAMMEKYCKKVGR